MFGKNLFVLCALVLLATGGIAGANSVEQFCVNVNAGGRVPPSGESGVSCFTFTVDRDECCTITDLDVRLSIKHYYDSDLDVKLISPAGTEVWLFTDLGNSGDNFQDTYLDDEAATSIENGTPPFKGPEWGGIKYNLEGSALLSAFDGEDACGNWTLKVIDDDCHTSSNTGWLYKAGEDSPWDNPSCGKYTVGTKLCFTVDCDDDQTGQPLNIPEPLTLLTGLMGLGAVGNYLRRRRMA